MGRRLIRFSAVLLIFMVSYTVVFVSYIITSGANFDYVDKGFHALFIYNPKGGGNVSCSRVLHNLSLNGISLVTPLYKISNMNRTRLRVYLGVNNRRINLSYVLFVNSDFISKLIGYDNRVILGQDYVLAKNSLVYISINNVNMRYKPVIADWLHGAIIFRKNNSENIVFLSFAAILPLNILPDNHSVKTIGCLILSSNLEHLEYISYNLSGNLTSYLSTGIPRHGGKPSIAFLTSILSITSIAILPFIVLFTQLFLYDAYIIEYGILLIYGLNCRKIINIHSKRLALSLLFSSTLGFIISQLIYETGLVKLNEYHRYTNLYFSKPDYIGLVVITVISVSIVVVLLYMIDNLLCRRALEKTLGEPLH